MLAAWSCAYHSRATGTLRGAWCRRPCRTSWERGDPFPNAGRRRSGRRSSCGCCAHREEHWRLSGKLGAASDTGFKVAKVEGLPDAAAGAAAAVAHQNFLPQLAGALLCLDVGQDPGCRRGGCGLSGAPLGLPLLLLRSLVHDDQLVFLPVASFGFFGTV